MRIGCDPPYLADPVQVREFAQGAEELGFDHLSFSEHVAASGATDQPPGFAVEGPWHESTTLAAFLAGTTSRIELNQPVDAAAGAASGGARGQADRRDRPAVRWSAAGRGERGLEPRGGRGAGSRPGPASIRRRGAGSRVVRRGWARHRPAGRPATATLDRAARLADGFKIMAPLGADPDLARRVADDLRARAVRHGRDPAWLGLEASILVQATTPAQWVEQVKFRRGPGASHIGPTSRILGGGVDDQLALVRRFAEETGLLERAR